jgi:hypothetical protein
MKLNLTINAKWVDKLRLMAETCINMQIITSIAVFASVIATIYAFNNDIIIAYGDAESHLNISKRVVDSLTPGLAQLGGIWLPLPHLAMVPFVYFDFLWRTGFAGSIVSGAAYVIACIYVFKTTYLLTRNKAASFIAFIIFALNPNVLYLQATPMTELILIMFFILSTYYFISFLKRPENIVPLIFAAFFGFCASLSRYDGWFLVLFEAAAIFLFYVRHRSKWKELEGKFILFCTLAFFGIALWMLWDFLILKDPFYFTNSQFSAKTQQQTWFARGELPAYKNIWMAFAYYFVTSMSNTGMFIFLTALGGFIYFLKDRKNFVDYLIALILVVPFIFNVTTLYLGQSVIFIPHLTPVSFEWRLFNVRYGVMMMPIVAIFFAYLFSKLSGIGRVMLIGVFFVQVALFGIGYSKVLSYADGIDGLSHAKRPNAEQWIVKNYDGGFVLMDDYARTVSIVRSGIPMHEVIYIGNKPYWEESLEHPEKHATWVLINKYDVVWQKIYQNPQKQKNLYAIFRLQIFC